MHRSIRVVLVAMMICGLVGCTKQKVQKLAIFPRDGETGETFSSVRHDGMYLVQYTKHKQRIWPDGLVHHRYLRAGDRVGFRERDDGTLVAVAGDESIELADAPDVATHVMWYHRSKRPTRFAKNMAAFGEFGEKALIVAGTGTLIVGGVFLYLWALDDDDCDRPSTRRHTKPR